MKRGSACQCLQETTEEYAGKRGNPSQEELPGHTEEYAGIFMDCIVIVGRAGSRVCRIWNENMQWMRAGEGCVRYTSDDSTRVPGFYIVRAISAFTTIATGVV